MRPTENGWIEGWPGSRLLGWARRRQEWGDEQKPNDMRNVASTEKRARGFVAEKFLSAWLRAQGCEFVENGGPDPLPDMEIAGRHIGVRLCAVRDRFRPHHLIYVFDRHRARVDGWFFCGTEMHSGRYLLLGGVTRERFFQGAWRVEPGGPVCPGFIAEEAVWVQRANVLTPPAAWLAGL